MLTKIKSALNTISEFFEPPVHEKLSEQILTTLQYSSESPMDGPIAITNLITLLNPETDNWEANFLDPEGQIIFSANIFGPNEVPLQLVGTRSKNYHLDSRTMFGKSISFRFDNPLTQSSTTVVFGEELLPFAKEMSCYMKRDQKNKESVLVRIPVKSHYEFGILLQRAISLSCEDGFNTQSLPLASDEG